MRNFTARWLSWTAALLTLAMMAFASSATAAPGITDNGKFFSPEALERLNFDIKKIHTDFGKELVVETFAGIPESQNAAWEAAKNDPKLKNEFFSKWLAARAHELQVNGVYVLITKDPGHLEVKAGKKTKEKAFTEVNQDKMRDILLAAFKDEKFDEGMQSAVTYFRDTLKENLGGVIHTGPSAAGEEQFPHSQSGNSSGSHFPMNNSGVPRMTTSGGHSVMWVILVILGVIVIIRILSSLGNRGNYGGGGSNYGPGVGGNFGSGYGGGYSSGGGGFFRNMLGGMLGGAAGGYLYDRFRDRNEGNNAPMQNSGSSDTSSGGSFGGSGASDQGEGFGGGGSSGDFGSSSSGSDMSSGGDFGGGGGDSGGGDSGGGGGGGDSGGGSGGDF